MQHRIEKVILKTTANTFLRCSMVTWHVCASFLESTPFRVVILKENQRDTEVTFVGSSFHPSESGVIYLLKGQLLLLVWTTRPKRKSLLGFYRGTLVSSGTQREPTPSGNANVYTNKPRSCSPPISIQTGGPEFGPSGRRACTHSSCGTGRVTSASASLSFLSRPRSSGVRKMARGRLSSECSVRTIHPLTQSKTLGYPPKKDRSRGFLLVTWGEGSSTGLLQAPPNEQTGRWTVG